ncbi:MAG: alpha/beta hydrolase domain-containing protein, partial [Myxococcales bacterium]
TATFVPTDTVAHVSAFSGFCILYGYNIPFDEARLDSLYRNHGDYVLGVVRESARLVEERFWLVPDATDAIRRAARADVP